MTHKLPSLQQPCAAMTAASVQGRSGLGHSKWEATASGQHMHPWRPTVRTHSAREAVHDINCRSAVLVNLGAASLLYRPAAPPRRMKVGERKARCVGTLSHHLPPKIDFTMVSPHLCLLHRDFNCCLAKPQLQASSLMLNTVPVAQYHNWIPMLGPSLIFNFLLCNFSTLQHSVHSRNTTCSQASHLEGISKSEPHDLYTCFSSWAAS